MPLGGIHCCNFSDPANSNGHLKWKDMTTLDVEKYDSTRRSASVRGVMSTRSATSASSGSVGGGGARRGHKERSKNFTELEKRTVLELIARHRDVLRQGRSNNATNRSKQLVWSTICEEVNARCGGGERPRTPAQVKMWYENYKKKCKMRATTDQHAPNNATGQQEAPSLLDGMLWQNIHPLDLKEEEGETATSEGARSVKDDDCLPINMSNGRVSSCNDERDETIPNVLEPQVQIIPQSSPSPPSKTPIPPLAPLTNLQTLANPLHVIEQARFTHNYFQKLNELSNTPLNLSHLDSDERKSNASPKKHEPNHKQDCSTATDEERLYYTAKRQHAIWEHEAKMKILNMELKQKEELFSLQKQLFLIELKLKMDFLEKASAK